MVDDKNVYNENKMTYIIAWLDLGNAAAHNSIR